MNVQSALLAQFRNAARDPEPEFDRDAFAEPELSHLDPIVSAAILVTSAFRLARRVGADHHAPSADQRGRVLGGRARRGVGLITL